MRRWIRRVFHGKQQPSAWPGSSTLLVLAEDLHLLITRIQAGTLRTQDEYEEALADIEQMRGILNKCKVFVNARIEMTFKIPQNYEKWKSEQRKEPQPILFPPKKEG